MNPRNLTRELSDLALGLIWFAAVVIILAGLIAWWVS